MHFSKNRSDVVHKLYDTSFEIKYKTSTSVIDIMLLMMVKHEYFGMTDKRVDQNKIFVVHSA